MLCRKIAEEAIGLLQTVQGLPLLQGSFHCQGVTINLDRSGLPQASLAYFERWCDQLSFHQCRDDLFSGVHVNVTENMPALHMYLRYRGWHQTKALGYSIASQVNAQLNKMRFLSECIRQGDLQPAGKPITDIVHIGVGGSALGTELCYQALESYHDSHVNIHFITVIDAHVLDNLLNNLNPETTLCFIVSKSFATEETLCQAHRARDWYHAHHLQSEDFLLVSTASQERAKAFGIKEQNILSIPPWVGGRFSLWSSVSFSLIVAIGFSCFERLLQGAFTMDQHFLQTELSCNIPVLMAWLSVWYMHVQGLQSQAIIPYTHHLEKLPAYLQQLQMESLGKSIDKDGLKNNFLVSPVILGDVGTRAQHALSQYIMQAPMIVPIDMLIINKDDDPMNKRLKYNAQAQSGILWSGYVVNGLEYQTIEPHRPHTMIEMNELSPEALGSLLAAYEHKTFVLGTMFHINVFDQWGVEQAKAYRRVYSVKDVVC